MTDQDIDFKIFGAYMAAKGLDPQCPICKKKQWAFISETEGFSYAHLGLHRLKRDIFDANVVNILFLHCKHCGFIAHFLREDVVRWIDEQPSPKGISSDVR